MENENNSEIKMVTNENMLNSNKNTIKFSEQNLGEITKEQFEIMKKIRDETLSRTERYSELIKDPDSNEVIFDISSRNKKKIKQQKTNDNTIRVNNTIGIIDSPKKEKEEEINPNKERLYHASHPFLFIKGEPIIILGPDTLYYVWIFSFVSFFSIIIYSLKNSHIFFKILFFCGYLFFAVTYTMLLLLNPGFPKNKNNLEPNMLQNHYKQCNDCNGISFKQEGKMTLHCEKCKICIEHFDHHCNFATKCIGRGNKSIFKLWLYSIGAFFVICFFYLIF